ncbi:hypothetical protein DID80_02185 [Candidatus Marinamargulisbacteria bacterium SCGC AAA071-K20]|nr:hypothetical protein DID80_02185 [Candidatus Marinamargulisbacteria bacterium SCGC AAA071-K20]
MNLDRLKTWDIESKYPVENITLNNNEVWPYLRELLIVHLSYQQFPVNISSFKLFSTLSRLGNIVFGLKNWFKSVHTVCFSFNINLSLFNGNYVDRYIGGVVASPDKNALVIEYATSRHLPMSKRVFKQVCSFSLINSLAFILSKVYFLFSSLKGKEVLNKICEEYKISKKKKKQIIKKLVHFHCRYILYRWVFKIKKIKEIVCTCHYQVLPEIKAAKELGLKVTEFQHGIIDQYHVSFMRKKQVSLSFLPDQLLVFGDKVKKNFTDKAHFIAQENIHVVGNYFIDLVKNNTVKNKLLSELRAQYEKIIVVPSISNFEKEMISFTVNSAKIDQGIAYLYFPRVISTDVRKWLNNDPQSNVYLLEDLSFYDCLSIADFHSTTFSTTAIEAPSFGVTTIAMVLDCHKKDVHPKDHFESIIPEGLIEYVESPEAFVEKIRTKEVPDRTWVINKNETNYFENYSGAINQYI